MDGEDSQLPTAVTFWIQTFALPLSCVMFKVGSGCSTDSAACDCDGNVTPDVHGFLVYTDPNLVPVNGSTKSSTTRLLAGTYRLCWWRFEVSEAQYVEESDFLTGTGLLVVRGPFPNQSSECYVGAQCVVVGLQGAKLAQDDLLLPMQLCGTPNMSSVFPNPQPISAAFTESHELVFDFGVLPTNTSPEKLQLCWCASRSSCILLEDFRATAMTLEVVCPPGTYELLSIDLQCQECPPGYFCPGGQTAELRQCPEARTSPPRSSAEGHCQCRRGTYWDAESGSCRPCLIGSYKNRTGGTEFCQSCPVGTTTLDTGAIALHECYCANNYLDMNLDPERFDCTEQASPSLLSAQVQIMNHWMCPDKLKRTSSLALLKGLARVSLALSAASGRLDYEITSSDAELATELHAKFDQAQLEASQIADVPMAQKLQAAAAKRAPQVCGTGSFCHGGDHREACPLSTSTLVLTASSVADCVCAAGHFGFEVCEECPAGRFKDLVGQGECSPCPIGTWSNVTGAVSDGPCTPCVSGSTTEFTGSWTEDLCIRPHGEQRVDCTTGAGCEVQIDGFNLQDGHRLLISQTDCGGRKVAVLGVADTGMSEAASEDGSLYAFSDFVPFAGNYHLCWCANMNDLACVEEEDFQISAGDLRVLGPFGNQKFSCVRGRDCTGFQVQGIGLSQGRRVAVRSDCGTESTLHLSPANPDGSGLLQGVEQFTLDFGSSQDGIDHSVSLDESEGYTLCWCGVWPCDPQDFVVPFGQLVVEGPRKNQEVSCAAGQPCALTEILGQLRPGDRIMVLAACGTGSAISGFPGGGIAEVVDLPEQAARYKVATSK
ncbi:ZEP [Symbiodinium necroappetens]|uniref:ZEP protein n=1 Tax=Symbiodinium necroappetens TaxID=1628268 RepID=A0A812SXI8_9DINO|nr:ZEP [Symbiodinium necroappetens]